MVHCWRKQWASTLLCFPRHIRSKSVPTEEASARTLMTVVSVIGLIFAIVMVILFFNASPDLSDIPEHRTYTDATGCLTCHFTGDEQSPTMPHLNIGYCNFCHQLAKGEQKRKPWNTLVLRISVGFSLDSFLIWQYDIGWYRCRKHTFHFIRFWRLVQHDYIEKSWIKRLCGNFSV